MPDFDDGYDGYYAQRLWALLPEVYRTDDTDASGAAGPLQELLNRVGAQAAVVRRSLDRLWADQSIETCDDWVIPYIGDLLGTNLINGLDARGQRLDVAKTIYYRRRKGTLAVLEELAHDVTGWPAQLVESFRRLSRTRHGLDPMVGAAAFPNLADTQATALLQKEGLVGALTGTPAGGLADLRNVHGATLTASAFDEFCHSVDVRRGRGALGHFGIPKLLVFLWRLTSFLITAGTPVAVAGCPGQFVFDPTGREIPLFLPQPAHPGDYADNWTASTEAQVPGPITSGLERGAPFGYTVTGADIDTVWPELGRFKVSPANPGPLTVGYQYAFSAAAGTLYVGAGPYDRLSIDDPPAQTGPVTTVSGGTGLAAALGALASTSTLVVDDSLTYADVLPDLGTSTPITAVLVQASNEQRPVLRPAAVDPPEWVFTGSAGAQLTLDGLLISGCDIVLRGTFDTVRITACTLDPGTLNRGEPTSPPAATPLASAVDGALLRPTTIWIERGAGDGAIRQLVIDHSIVGPIRTRYGGAVEALTITDSIIQAIPTTVGPQYSPADVYDPALLAASYRATDPLAQKLLGALPTAAQSALDTYAAPDPVPQAVVDGLNGLVAGASQWDAVSFAAVPLDPDLKALVAQPPSPTVTPDVNRGLLDAAFPGALGPAAVAVSDATVTLTRVTVLGRLAVHRLYASDSIITGFADVDDTQNGCVRFSAYVGGSRVPRQYESLTTGTHASLFTSTDYGDPGYAQLLEAVDQAVTGGTGSSISAGSDRGSEMGAFCACLAPIREHGLLTKYAEYMPLGLTPVVIHVT
ncbi:hypothetical protein OS122_04705 [Mycolicibacterium mucogenicum]|uniref:hypothetical protein n=1 Tax=Mycolicibacterium mucogenicum TaxID=56689 RepID=UPI002269FE0B|nr:hypothetical protein [Mycolicibacterium mucogenicum]MCX8560192.1 hypothetical protein [Mycolicibacterium mucogenicum]